MYFNETKENTNIDNQFNNKPNFKDVISKFKLPLIIIGSVLLLSIIIIIIILVVKNRTSYFITLEGSSEMMVYKDSVYNEPGYSGLDNKNNDLTNEVVVSGEVDTSKIDTYTITYKLKNTTKTRTIKVIAKPAQETLIYLNGNSVIHLKVGETYEEPGYSVIDNLDGDLNDKVKITGKVDTTKKGTYKIVYSVENSVGVTTSATRTVIVE